MTAMRFVRKSQHSSPSPSSFIIAFGVLDKPPALPSPFTLHPSAPAAVSQAKRYPHLHLLPSSVIAATISYKDDDDRWGIPIVHLAVVLLPPPAACRHRLFGIELISLVSDYVWLLDNNNLSGYLPPDFSSLPQLRILQLDNNNFKGSDIPASYGNFSILAKLSLRNCSLQGAVPDLSRIPSLSYLDLSHNLFSGPIPSNKLSDNMTTIDLSDNQLNGTIPESFSDLPSLQALSLQNNFLIGPVPSNIWQNVSFNASARLTMQSITRKCDVFDFGNENKGVSRVTLVAVVVGGVVFAVAMSVIVAILITRRHARHHRAMSRKRLWEQMLVYEFMPNGTLRDWLSGSNHLYSGKSLTEPPSYGSTNREAYVSSSFVSGSDLVSGDVPSIAPR
ncbi:hypothetical protein V6N11_019630 [Hibiscus sabdariffa]|uniref:Uncharacterized protein n=1 Tax=Hibiscus sabdariffa TaxID=183260 RepID=A0ABR2NLB1_9ROSI